MDDTENVFETLTEEMRIELNELAIAIRKEKGKAPKPMVALCIGIGLHMLKGVFSASQLKAEIRNLLNAKKKNS